MPSRLSSCSEVRVLTTMGQASTHRTSSSRVSACAQQRRQRGTPAGAPGVQPRPQRQPATHTRGSTRGSLRQLGTRGSLAHAVSPGRAGTGPRMEVRHGRSPWGAARPQPAWLPASQPASLTCRLLREVGISKSWVGPSSRLTSSSCSSVSCPTSGAMVSAAAWGLLGCLGARLARRCRGCREHGRG